MLPPFTSFPPFFVSLPLLLLAPHSLGVCCHWCVSVCVHECLCVCVHAQGMETPKVGPMTSDPLLLLKLPVAETIKKSRQGAAHKIKERETKKEKGRRRTEQRKRERAGKEGKPSCKQHNANESLAEAQSCSERVPPTNPLHPSLTN